MESLKSAAWLDRMLQTHQESQAPHADILEHLSRVSLQGF